MKKSLSILILLGVFFSASLQARPKVALVLAGGGSRGLSEIPVLEAIVEEGIPVDMIVGTSFGAILGGMLSSGYSTSEIRKIISGLDYLSFFTTASVKPEKVLPYASDPFSDNYFSFAFSKHGLGATPGVIGDNKINLMLDYYFSKVHHIENFDDLEIPFRAVTSDISTGKPVVLNSGSISSAIRSSMSIPLVWQPYPVDGVYGFDGGVTRNTPVRIAKELGADIVIAVDVMNDVASAPEKISGLETAGLQLFMMMLSAQNEEEHPKADVLICPELADFFPFDFIHVDEIINAGQKAVDAKRGELHELALRLQKEGVELNPRSSVYEGTYNKRPDPIVEEIIVKDISLTGPYYLPSPKELNFFNGKKLDDDMKLQLNHKLEKLKDKYHLSSLSYFARKGSTEETCILELHANHYYGNLNKVFLGGDNSIAVGKKIENGPVTFNIVPKLTAGVLLAGPFETLIKGQLSETVKFGVSTFPKLYEAESGFKMSLGLGVHFAYGSLSPETSLLNKDRLAAEDNSFNAEGGVRFSYLDLAQLSLGAFYKGSWLHGQKKVYHQTGAFLDGAFVTMDNRFTSLSGLYFGAKADYLFDHSYSAKLDFSNRIEIVRNRFGFGFDCSAGLSTKNGNLLESFYDYGGFYGLIGNMPGTLVNDYGFFGATAVYNILEIAGMPLSVVIKVNCGWNNISETLKKPDAGAGLYGSLKTPFGSFILGAGLNTTGNWNVTCGFN